MAKTATKKQPTELAVVKSNVPANVDMAALRKQAAGKGTSTDQADNVVPLLKVLQPLSPQVLKQKAEFIKGAEAGMIYPRGEKQVWDAEEGVRVVPCYYERVWLEWAPERAGLRGRHRNGKDNTPALLGAHKQKDANGKEVWTLPSGNTLDDTREHVVLVLDKYDSPTPFVLSMNGSNIGTSRAWHPMMNRKFDTDGAKCASYEYVYTLKSVAKSNDKGDWFQMAIEDTGEKTSDDVFLIADRLHNDFAGGILKADVEEPLTDTQQHNDDSDVL